MLKPVTISTMLAAMVCLASTPSLAKDCKPALTQAGEGALTRLIAYPASLLAWRKAAREKYGETYESWRHSAAQNIDCRPSGSGLSRRWVCIRTAQPCTGDNPKGIDATRLQRGDKGDQVSALQAALNDHGYKLTVDGNFGSGTERAVRDFQRKQSLKVDGIVGKETRERLQS